MTAFQCQMSTSDAIYARRCSVDEEVVIETPENSFYLTPSDARAFAAEIVKLADEIDPPAQAPALDPEYHPWTRAEYGAPTPFGEDHERRLADLEAHIESLQGFVDHLDHVSALHGDRLSAADDRMSNIARRVGSVEAYMGAPKLQPLTQWLPPIHPAAGANYGV